MQIGPRIHFDSHTLGNLVKNISPALAFTPLGLAGTGIAAGLGEIGRGKHSFGDIAKSVGSNVAIGAGARGAAGHFGIGPSAAPAEIPQVSSQGSGFGLPGTTYTQGADGSYGAPSVAPGVAPAGDEGGGVFSKIASGVGHALDHDKTTAAVLGGLGNLGTAGAQNRAQNAQAKLLEQQAQEGEYDYNSRKARDLALEPLRQALYGKLGQVGNVSPVAPDPYLPRAA